MNEEPGNFDIETTEKAKVRRQINLHVSLKTQKNEENTTHVLYQINYIYKFLHRIPSYKLSHDKKECISIHSFELNPTTLPIDKFQLTEEHDQAQNKILELHSLFVTLILYEGLWCENIYS
ncbi:hypothetical protein MTR_6g057790 [Medicago truncatula]|uniref:Uncharacterized protein n=1 Tax=Medicago truncatula TaxID=3880 RepID=G7KMF7_MEDTR|nr:hypothetical protein MTR_6g057790 [Medicago truncatula]